LDARLCATNVIRLAARAANGENGLLRKIRGKAKDAPKKAKRRTKRPPETTAGQSDQTATKRRMGKRGQHDFVRPAGREHKLSQPEREERAAICAKALRTQPKSGGAWEGVGQKTLNDALALACGHDSHKSLSGWGPNSAEEELIERAGHAAFNATPEEDDPHNARRVAEEKLRQKFRDDARLAVCEQLLRFGADPRANGQRALLCAVRLNDHHLIRTLVEHGARADACEPLHIWASERNGQFYPRMQMLAALSRAGARMDDKDARRALGMCAKQADARGVKALIALARGDAESGAKLAQLAIVELASGWAAKKSIFAPRAGEEWDEWQLEQWRRQSAMFAEALERIEKMALNGSAEGWGQAAAAAARHKWTDLMRLTVERGGQTAAQRALWAAWRTNDRPMFELALSLGADPDLAAPKTEPAAPDAGVAGKTAAKSLWRRFERLDGSLGEGDEADGLSINEARATKEYGGWGRSCAAVLDARSENDELRRVLGMDVPSVGAGVNGSEEPGARDPSAAAGVPELATREAEPLGNAPESPTVPAGRGAKVGRRL
jgi:hypothetical protein